MDGRGDRTEAIVWVWSGAALFIGSVVLMALAYVLYATVPDLDTVTDEEGFQDLNERFRLINRLIDIGQPGAVAGAIGLFTGAALLRSPGRIDALRASAGTLLAASALFAVVAGWRSTSANFGISSTSFKVWAWVEAGAWLGIGAAGILLFISIVRRAPSAPATVSTETQEPNGGRGAFSVRDRS